MTSFSNNDGMTDISEAMLADRRRVAEDYARAFRQLREEAATKGIALPAYEHNISAVRTVADILPPDFVLECCEMRMPGFCNRMTQLAAAADRQRQVLEARRERAEERRIILRHMTLAILPIMLLIAVGLLVVLH